MAKTGGLGDNLYIAGFNASGDIGQIAWGSAVVLVLGLAEALMVWLRRWFVLGPATRVVDTSVAEGAVVQFSVVSSSRIGARAQVGPYAHVRPGTRLGPDTKVGAFVEIKASEVGEGGKVPHLTYVGDAKVGRRANIGAGTVTVNYDGYAKHRTRIGDDARVGSDTMLVAPVRLGKGAVTGAGSVITTDVPAGALAVERSEQRVVKGYRKRRDAEAVAGKKQRDTEARAKGKGAH